ncbi:MAG: putative zinc protease ymxG [Microgenomates bacterium 39_7]|nr:MAG: putative zinc protease ymxG [Microgenomates bacterium 39_7]
MFNVIHQKLDSGSRLIMVPMSSLKSITALVLVNTGSRYEESTKLGAAHLLEHLVFKGTKNYPDGYKLSIALDSIGASSNAFTSKEYTGFYVTAASNHLEYCLKILKELVFFPLIRPHDVDSEKSVVIEEIKMYRDSPDDFISDEYEQAIYRGTSLEHPICGTIESVQRQSAASLREFLQKWYGLENITLVIAGDELELNKPDLLKNILKIFSEKDIAKTRSKNHVLNRANGHQQRRQKFLTNNSLFSDEKLIKRQRPTEQAHVVLGWPALERDHPQRFALNLLSTIMGGNRSSRLFYTVREQANLAYYVYSDVDQYHDGGLLGVSAGLNLEKKEEGIKLITDEFMQLVDGTKPLSEAELKRAKDYLTGRIYLGLENSNSVARHYGLSHLLYGRIEHPQEVVEGINSVKLEQIEKLAKKLISAKEMRLAVVSPD